jgi:hypothetical protein
MVHRKDCRALSQFFFRRTVDVIAPGLSYPWLTIPICCVIALNLHMHYFYVCTIPPGFVEDPPRQEGSRWLWAKRRSRRRLTGVRWSDNVRITRAMATKCRKCGQLKPEVRVSAYRAWRRLTIVGSPRGRTIVVFAIVACSNMTIIVQ